MSETVLPDGLDYDSWDVIPLASQWSGSDAWVPVRAVRLGTYPAIAAIATRSISSVNEEIMPKVVFKIEYLDN